MKVTGRPDFVICYFNFPWFVVASGFSAGCYGKEYLSETWNKPKVDLRVGDRCSSKWLFGWSGDGGVNPGEKG